MRRAVHGQDVENRRGPMTADDPNGRMKAADAMKQDSVVLQPSRGSVGPAMPSGKQERVMAELAGPLRVMKIAIQTAKIAYSDYERRAALNGRMSTLIRQRLSCSRLRP